MDARRYRPGCVYPALITPAQVLQAALAGISVGWGHGALLSITLQLGRGTVLHWDPAATSSCPALPCSSGWGRTEGHPAATGTPLWLVAGFDVWPGPRRGDEEREDATFPPSAQPCCDKTGNVTWKAPVYSPRRKKNQEDKGPGSICNQREGFCATHRSCLGYGSCRGSRRGVRELWGALHSPPHGGRDPTSSARLRDSSLIPTQATEQQP